MSNTHDSKEVEMRGGGPLVKDWGTHFLRDDTELRRGDPFCGDQMEAYSLFCIEPYGRVRVFGGTKEWALKEATKLVEEARNA